MGVLGSLFCKRSTRNGSWGGTAGQHCIYGSRLGCPKATVPTYGLCWAPSWPCCCPAAGKGSDIPAESLHMFPFCSGSVAFSRILCCSHTCLDCNKCWGWVVLWYFSFFLNADLKGWWLGEAVCWGEHCAVICYQWLPELLARDVSGSLWICYLKEKIVPHNLA